jgi:Flp pilus assembly protein protease CpaA
LLALGYLAFRFVRNRAQRGAGVQSKADAGGESIPYAPAIALGVWLSLVPKG